MIELERLAEDIEKKSTVNGWLFSFEYPGFFVFYKDGFSTYCTPDEGTEGALCIQVTNAEGEPIGDGDQEIAYQSPLTAEQFMTLMNPVLRRVDETIIQTGVRS